MPAARTVLLLSAGILTLSFALVLRQAPEDAGHASRVSAAILPTSGDTPPASGDTPPTSVSTTPASGDALPTSASTPPASSDAPPTSPGTPPLSARWESRYDSVRTNLSDYIWPTEAGRGITSTFGEFRKTHFHAGIDVSTGDRTGFKTFAARAGYVWRISVSPEGYGKVLFVRHRDGYTTVYAHLDRFSKSIEARVRREQERLERYPVDITCVPEELPVAKGEVIAYTGETGAGSPHLHFEIRDEHMNAVNPLLCPAFDIEDDIKPGANAIALIPIGPGSRVDGLSAPSIRRLALEKSGRMAARTGFTLSGDAGVAINIRDRSNETWYRHGVYRHTLRIDDSIAFAVRLDRVPVNEGQQISLYYSWPLRRAGRGRYEKLFVDGWHELPFLSSRDVGAGVISAFRLVPGLHTVSVRSEDIHGNATETIAEVTITPAQDQSLPAWQPSGGADGSTGAPLDIDLSLAGEFIHVTATARGAFTARPLLTVREGSSEHSIPMQLASASRAVATFPPEASHQGARTLTVNAEVAGAPARGERTRSVYVVDPGRPGSFAVKGGALTVLFDSTSTFGPLALTVDHADDDGQAVYSFDPEDAVLHDGFTVLLRPDRNRPKQALYVRTQDRWDMIRTEATQDGRLRGRMRRILGDLTVLSDTTAPTIGRLRVQQRPGRKLSVSFGFDDDLSGVDYESMKLYLDDRFRVPEIDGEHNRVVFLSAEPLSAGPHRVTISFSDELGNTTSVERSITVR